MPLLQALFIVTLIHSMVIINKNSEGDSPFQKTIVIENSFLGDLLPRIDAREDARDDWIQILSLEPNPICSIVESM